MNLKTAPRIFVAATMRSGSTLVSNILNAHSKILIMENFHFQRFIYKDGKPLNKKKIHWKIKEMEARLKLRYNINQNSDRVLSSILKKKLNYKNVYDSLIEYHAKKNRVEILGEDSAMNWRFIETFSKMYKNAKIIHILRDPRSVFASWKKATYQKNDYWGCIFNCIDNMNYAGNLKKKLSSKNYLVVKFEDILKKPSKHCKTLCKFLNIKFEKQMILPKHWSSIFKNKDANLGWSSIEKKSMDSFDRSRISSWKKHLTSLEIFVIESLMKQQLKKWKYKIYNHKVNVKEFDKFLIFVNNSNYLKKNLFNYLKNGEGTDKYKNDPTNPFTWGGKNVNKKKFVDSKNGKKYLKILRKINKQYA